MMHELERALELYEERAAIIEFDAKVSRATAESRAMYVVAMQITGDKQESYKLVEEMRRKLRNM